MNVDIKISDERLNLDMMQPLTEGSAGIDLYACIDSPLMLRQGYQYPIPTGFSLNMKDTNMAAMIIPRSGLATKEGIILANTVGLIDSDYQGEIKVVILNRQTESIGVRGKVTIEPMQRIAQLIFVPVLHPELKQVKEFKQQTKRGKGGFGSTDKGKSKDDPTNKLENML